MNSLQYKTLEIVGLENGSDGRLCGIHITNCGVAFDAGTKLILRKATVEVQVLKNIPVKAENAALNDPPTKKRGRPKKATVEYENHYVIETE